MVKEDDLEAGRPEFQPETDLKSGLALLFLQDSKMLRRFMASTLSFFNTRGSTISEPEEVDSDRIESDRIESDRIGEFS